MEYKIEKNGDSFEVKDSYDAKIGHIEENDGYFEIKKYNKGIMSSSEVVGYIEEKTDYFVIKDTDGGLTSTASIFGVVVPDGEDFEVKEDYGGWGSHPSLGCIKKKGNHFEVENNGGKTIAKVENDSKAYIGAALLFVL
jgi:hypothetical protein